MAVKSNTLSFKVPLFVGWMIVGVTIFLVALTFLPDESRSSYFWLRILWTEILWLLFCLGIAFYVLVAAGHNDSATLYGGIAPAIVLTAVCYGALSFATMVIDSIVTE